MVLKQGKSGPAHVQQIHGVADCKANYVAYNTNFYLKQLYACLQKQQLQICEKLHVIPNTNQQSPGRKLLLQIRRRV